MGCKITKNSPTKNSPQDSVTESDIYLYDELPEMKTIKYKSVKEEFLQNKNQEIKRQIFEIYKNEINKYHTNHHKK